VLLHAWILQKLIAAVAASQNNYDDDDEISYFSVRSKTSHLV